MKNIIIVFLIINIGISIILFALWQPKSIIQPNSYQVWEETELYELVDSYPVWEQKQLTEYP